MPAIVSPSPIRVRSGATDRPLALPFNCSCPVAHQLEVSNHHATDVADQNSSAGTSMNDGSALAIRSNHNRLARICGQAVIQHDVSIECLTPVQKNVIARAQLCAIDSGERSPRSGLCAGIGIVARGADVIGRRPGNGAKQKNAQSHPNGQERSHLHERGRQAPTATNSHCWTTITGGKSGASPAASDCCHLTTQTRNLPSLEAYHNRMRRVRQVRRNRSMSPPRIS